MSLAERRWLRLFTLCILYVAQGIPFGFMAVALPAYIKGTGVGEAVVAGALVMTTLPYTFKWIWGPVMDLVTIPALGRRRPWIMFAQLMMAATVIAMLAIPDVTTELEMLAVFIFVHAVFNSMQDVAVDALAIDLLDDDERGRANGLMYACKYGGVVIGGAGMGRVVGAYGLSTALIVQTAILLAILVVPLLVRERSKPAPRPPVHEVFAGLAQVATLRTTLVLALLMLAITITSGVLAVGSMGLYMGELKWPAEDYTDLAGGLAYVAGFGGSILGGVLADAVGRKKLVALASIGMALGWLLFAAAKPLWHLDGLISVFAVWGAICQAMMIVSSFALCMDATWARVAATQFAAFMAMQALSTTLGYKLAPIVLEQLTYQEMYFAAAAAQLAVTSLLVFVDSRELRTLPLAPGWRINAIGILTFILVVATIGIVPAILIL